ncbi:MAG TPA: DUF2993 domain-containing protein, partial [Streptomyces sp.]|nr:DUF2993 domain-containing protein [Streptomyces sp.]
MRVLRRGLIVLFVLAVLFVGGDRLAVALAEGEAADRINNSKDMPPTADTSVDIRGFPFLTQVASRDLEQIDATLTGMKAEAADSTLTVNRVDAHLKNVRINSDWNSAVAQEANGSALITYKDLTKAAPDGVRVSWGGKDGKGEGRLKVTAGISLLGQKFERSVISTVSLSGRDSVKLAAKKVPGEDIPGLE